MFRYVDEGSEITPGISIDEKNKVVFFMFATYKHRWCWRFRWQECNNKFLFTKTHWTLDDDIQQYLYSRGLNKEILDIRK